MSEQAKRLIDEVVDDQNPKTEALSGRETSITAKPILAVISGKKPKAAAYIVWQLIGFLMDSMDDDVKSAEFRDSLRSQL